MSNECMSLPPPTEEEIRAAIARELIEEERRERDFLFWESLFDDSGE